MKTIRAGDLVRVPFNGRLVAGRITEDRGRLGVGGRRLFHVEIPVEFGEPILKLADEDQIEEYRPLPPLTTEEVVEYLSGGGLIGLLRLEGRQPRVRAWLYRDGSDEISITFTPSLGELGGAEVPDKSYKQDRILASKVDEVVAFLQPFGLTVAEANDVVRRVGVTG